MQNFYACIDLLIYAAELEIKKYYICHYYWKNYKQSLSKINMAKIQFSMFNAVGNIINPKHLKLLQL